MTSAVVVSIPADGVPADKADFRANWSTIKSEIEALQAAGGGSTATINATNDFGVVGDGATDNSTTLIAMRDAMWAAPDAHHVIYFPPGEYLYSNNRWLLNVHSYEVLGHGCTFQNILTDTGQYDANFTPLRTANPWSDEGDIVFGTSFTPYNGYLIDTAARGAIAVTCSTAADAGNFAAGDRVLLHGFAHMADNSFPPSPRYFEWLEVASANGGTGVVTFRTTLRWFYDERWRDINRTTVPTGMWGAPRLMKLERANYIWPRRAWFRGGHWVGHPDEGAGLYFNPHGEHVLLEDLRLGLLSIQSSRLVECYGVHVEENCEPDKVVTHFHLGPGCVLEGTGGDRSLWGATGVQLFTADRADFRKRIQISPREFVIRNSTLHASTNWQWSVWARLGHWSIRRGVFEGCEFSNGHAALAAHFSHARGGGAFLYSATVDGVSGAALTFTDDGTGEGSLFESLELATEIGTTIVSTADHARGGRITNVYFSGGNIVVEGEWWVQPQAADVLLWTQVSDLVIDEACRFEGAPALKFDLPWLAYPGRREPRRIVLSEVDVPWGAVAATDVCGYICRIGVSVYRAYSGAGTTPLLRFAVAGGSTIMDVDIETVGWREITVAGGAGPSGAGDSYAGNALLGGWIRQLSWGGVDAAGSGSALPLVRIFAEVLA